MNSIKKLNLEVILISLIPISAVFSIFFLELSLVIVMSLFLIDIIKKKDFTIFNNFFSKIFIFFYLYLITRLFFSDYIIDEFVSIFFYFRYGLYVLAIFYFLKKYNYLERYFLIVTIFTLSILLFDGFFQFFVGKNIIGYPIVDGQRITSFFNDESILGSYLIKFLPFLYLFMFKNFKNQKVLIYSLTLLTATSVLIFLSGERAAFLLMLLLTLYFIFMIKKLKILRIIFFSISIISMIGIFFLEENIQSRYLQTVKELKKSENRLNNEILDRKYTIGNYYIISPTHNNYYITAYRMFLDNKIFGHGPKSFKFLCKDDRFRINAWSCSTHPHNYYLQLLAETGLIGFITIFVIFLLILARCLKIFFDSKKNFSLIEICLLSFFLVNLWPITSTGNFFNNWISILIYIPISFYLFYKDKNDF